MTKINSVVNSGEEHRPALRLQHGFENSLQLAKHKKHHRGDLNSSEHLKKLHVYTANSLQLAKHKKHHRGELSSSEHLNRLPEVQPRGKPPALGTGWITDAEFVNTAKKPFKSFAASWTVPPAPKTWDGQTIYLFNSIATSDAIIQPVLSYGYIPAGNGGGKYWSISSWYVTSKGTFSVTNPIRVSVGKKLTGIITRSVSAKGVVSYSSQFLGYAKTLLTVKNTHSKPVFTTQPSFTITLEAYDLLKRTDYPNTPATTFSNIRFSVPVKGFKPSWTIDNYVTDVGQHAKINSETSVSLYY